MSVAKAPPRIEVSWVRAEAAPYETLLKKAPPKALAAIIVQMFERAKTQDELRQAEALWIKYKEEVIKYVKQLQCDEYGEKGDTQVAKDLVEDLVDKPVGLIISVGKLVLNLAAIEKDEAYESLKEAVKELEDYLRDKVKGRAEKKLDEKFLAPLLKRFKEALLKVLQQHSKRSRKYFLELIEDIARIAKRRYR